MKRIICTTFACFWCVALSGCVATMPVISTYTNPPGVFIGIPVVPLEVGVQVRK